MTFLSKRVPKDALTVGGVLHRSDYPRSPLGVPIEHREHYEERYSYCFSVESEPPHNQCDSLGEFGFQIPYFC